MPKPFANKDALARYFEEISRYPQLTSEEETRLARVWHATKDRSAVNTLVTANLRFVVRMARKYQGYGLKILDMIQEGNLGLQVAAERFDPDRGVRLISFAVWWIKAYIQNYILAQWSLVKIGTTRAQRKLFYKLRQEKRRLTKASGGETPSTAILAESLNVTEKEIEEMEQRLNRDSSLDSWRSDEASHEGLLNTLVDHGKSSEDLLHEARMVKASSAAVAAAMRVLDPRERRIIEMRHLADRPMTLEDLGREYDVSRERIRQIETRALGRMRAALVKWGNDEDAPNIVDETVAIMAKNESPALPATARATPLRLVSVPAPKTMNEPAPQPRQPTSPRLPDPFEQWMDPEDDARDIAQEKLSGMQELPPRAAHHLASDEKMSDQDLLALVGDDDD